MFEYTSERADFDASTDLSLDEEDDTVFLEITAPTEKNVEAPQAQARKARASARATTTSWVPADENDVTTDHDYLGPEHIFDDDLRQPIEYVRQFLTDDLLETFVTQSNLYSVQRNSNKPLNTSKNELEQWLGLCIYFSISKLPNVRMHWSHHLGAMKDVAADVMSRNRWESIKSNFHMVDNSTISQNQAQNNDKLFKVRPMVDHLREKFNHLPKEQELCIDEQMIPFKGNSSLKQYVPSKPHKYGYKFFVLAGKDGMTYDFMPYTGKIKPVNDSAIPDLGASSNVVLHLSQTIAPNCNHYMFFDNWFTSLPLLEHLATRKIWCCGTVRQARLSGIKIGKKDEKDFMKKGRGAFEELKSTNKSTEITYVKWCDNKIVHLVSTFAKAHPVKNVSRYERKLSQRIDIPCPDIVQKYNQAMGGVDLADCLIALYRINIRSKKYYHRIIFHMIDMVLVNSWLLYKRDALHLQLPKSEVIPLAYFKIRVAFSLMMAGKECNRKRGRPSLQDPTAATAKVSKCGRPQSLPDNSIRYDSVGHWPSVEEQRKTCKRKGCSGKTNIACSKCKVNVCLNGKQNCFVQFHTK